MPSKRVIIELEFENSEVTNEDVYNYLKELMDNECLDWEFGETTVI